MRTVLENVELRPLLLPVVWSATAASLILDRAGFESAGIAWQVGLDAGTGLSSSHKVTPTLQESDTTVDADFTTVAAADMIYAPTVVDSTSKDETVQRIEYKGSKRFIRLLLTETGVVSCPMAILGVLGRATNAPVSAPTLGTTAT